MARTDRSNQPGYAQYRKTAATFKRRAQRENRPCALCGKPIDYTLPGSDRQGFTVDHIVPYSKDRSLFTKISNFQAAHRSCNSARGNGTRTKRTLGVVHDHNPFWDNWDIDSWRAELERRKREAA